VKSRSINRIAGTGVAVRGNDLDTDRIIPARYLKEVTFDHMGDYPFIDERFDDKGNQKPHPFNDPRYRSASILFVNDNFGCGSSREHAPQALHRFGIQAIVGESFAEIFSGNSLVIGMPLVKAAPDDIQRLMDLVEEDPTAQISLDLENKTLTAADMTVKVELPETTRSALVEGFWDSTATLAANLPKVRAVAARLPYANDFQATGAN